MPLPENQLAQEADLLGRMAALDTAAGPGDYTPVHGGAVVRAHVFTPAGLLVPEQLTGMMANPVLAGWWSRIIVEGVTVAPGAYL